ncbi:MAG TPA: hypothetical protein VEB68_03310 [Croceibacterium sp.]|nr:hypothetical protein [Croceibacterium sp.]
MIRGKSEALAASAERGRASKKTWTAPAVTRLGAAEAEFGPTPVVDDGAFSQGS